jgi:hypothetical protein
LEQESVSAPTAEMLQSLSDGELFARYVAAMRMLPSTIAESYARRRVWEAIFLLDEEIERRYPPITGQ